MSLKPRFVLHPEAAQDILEIWEFIAVDNPAVARRVSEEIFESIQSLVKFRYQGHRRLDLTSSPLRFQIVREYLIAYAPETEPLAVIAVLNGRRNPRVIAAILRSRE